VSGSKLLLAMVAVVIALWACCFLAVSHFLPSWAERGQFGDLFGSINALFSGLAFAGLIATIYLQRTELALQREELKLQREEMVASRAELAAQVAVQKAMLQVSIGQIRVNAEQARIEALKMAAESNTPGHRGDWINSINEAAARIEAIANELQDG
jgi:hypothetical protein